MPDGLLNPKGQKEIILRHYYSYRKLIFHFKHEQQIKIDVHPTQTCRAAPLLPPKKMFVCMDICKPTFISGAMLSTVWTSFRTNSFNFDNKVQPLFSSLTYLGSFPYLLGDHRTPSPKNNKVLFSVFLMLILG